MLCVTCLQGREWKADVRSGRESMDNHEVINDVLVHLFNEILRLEEEAIITNEYQDITNNDMHIIEAVGLGGGNMSSIAAKLNITVGSLTTSMNGLVKKGYAERVRSDRDRRVVYIHLTNKGRKAYHHHAEFHKKMTDAVLEALDEEEIPVLIKTLDGLSSFFRQYKK
jgi:DNA-binding MarR family transcriptional regulator